LAGQISVLLTILAMKTDSIFYRLFKEFPSSFFELIGRPASEANAYRFDSFELKQTAFRIDGLFLPLEDNSPQPLYFLEVQFRKDPKIYANLFAEVFVFLNQNDPGQDWRAVVVYESRNWEPTQLLPYQELLNSTKVLRVYLDELPEQTFTSLGLSIVQLIISSESVAVDRAKQLIARTQEEVKDEQIRLDILDLIETVLFYKFTTKSREELAQMFGIDDLKQTRLFQDILAEGREEGKLEVVPNLLARGFTVTEIAEILKLEVERVQQKAQESANS
jgi:predicted transposase/invertase (TIGR01784 family)